MKTKSKLSLVLLQSCIFVPLFSSESHSGSQSGSSFSPKASYRDFHESRTFPQPYGFASQASTLQKRMPSLSTKMGLPQSAQKKATRYAVIPARRLEVSNPPNTPEPLEVVDQDSTPRMKTDEFVAMLPRIESNFVQALCGCIKKHLYQAYPAFINVTVKEFCKIMKENPSSIKVSIEEYMSHALMDHEHFQYITRGNRSPRQTLGVYSYAQAAVNDDDGIINKVKRNVMDEMFSWINVFFNVNEGVLLNIEDFLDRLLEELSERITEATFDLLNQSEYLDQSGGFLRNFDFLKGVSKETKSQIANRLKGTICGVIESQLGSNFIDNVNGLAKSVCRAVVEREDAMDTL